jgi:hypothetical protein
MTCGLAFNELKERDPVTGRLVALGLLSEEVGKVGESDGAKIDED